MDAERLQAVAARVLRIEGEAVAALADRLDGRFARAVELLYACRGRVVLAGMGKSGYIAQKIAATFSSTGTPALFLHPAEGVHGDLGPRAGTTAGLAMGDALAIALLEEQGFHSEDFGLRQPGRVLGGGFREVCGRKASGSGRGRDGAAGQHGGANPIDACKLMEHPLDQLGPHPSVSPDGGED